MCGSGQYLLSDGSREDAGCLVEVIPAVAALGVGLHGNAGNYMGAHFWACGSE